MARKKGKGQIKPLSDQEGSIQQRRDENIVDDAEANLKGKDKMCKTHFGDFKPQDPDWYDNTPMFDSAGRLAFGYPVGVNFHLGNFEAVVPGVMAFDFMPTYGISDNADSPLNVASNLMFIKLRSVNSGFGKNYMPADMSMRVIAADNLYMIYQDLMRVYGILTSYVWSNKYMPRLLCEAMGFDYDDLMLNGGPAIQFQLQNAAEKINAFPLPTTFDVIKRHQFLASNYFIDGDSDKAQLFVPRISHLWKYGNTGATGTNLQLMTYHNTIQAQAEGSGNGMKLQEWVALFNSMYNAVAIDDDYAIMGGDIMKAFGANEVYKVLVPAMGYTTVPVYNELFLQQISNAFLPGSAVPTGSINQVVAVNASYITSTLTAAVSVLNGDGIPDLQIMDKWEHLVNTYINDPTPMDVVELTRFMPTWTAAAGEASVVLTFDSLGTELVFDAAVVVYSNSEPHLKLNENVYMVRSFEFLYDTSTVTQLENTIIGQIAMTQFHGYPLVRYFKITDGKPYFMGFMKNIENYAVLPKVQAQMLNEAVLRSVLHVDQPF